MRQRFDIADIIIKTEMVIKWKIEKNKLMSLFLRNVAQLQ